MRLRLYCDTSRLPCVCTKSYIQSSPVSRQFILEIKSRKTWQSIKKYYQNIAPFPATHIVDPIVAPPGFGRLVPSPVALADALHPPISSIVHPPENSPPRASRIHHLSTHRRPPATAPAPSRTRPSHLHTPATTSDGSRLNHLPIEIGIHGHNAGAKRHFQRLVYR